MSSFPLQSGNLSYVMSILPSTTTGGFIASLGKSASTGQSWRNAELIDVTSGASGIAYSLAVEYQFLTAGNPDSGLVSLYWQEEFPNPWEKVQELTGWGYEGSLARFGESVAIEDDLVLVGAPRGTPVSGETEQGVVCGFPRFQGGGTGGATGEEWGYAYSLTGRAETGGGFGSDIDVVLGGDPLIVVGAPLENGESGRAYIFDGDTTELISDISVPHLENTRELGKSVHLLSGAAINSVAMSSYTNSTGTVHIFQQAAGEGWGITQTLYAPSPEEDDLFGSSLAGEGETLIVGSPYYGGADHSGRVYIYNYNVNSNLWDFSEAISPNSLTNGDCFGKNVNIKGNNILIASNNNLGSVYVFEKNGTWKEVNQVSGAQGEGFGGNTSGSQTLGVHNENFFVGSVSGNQFSSFSTGIEPGDPSISISFSGESGKFFDQDGNYVYSYLSGTQLQVSGNIFTGYHNYFIDGIIINANCSRGTGVIDTYELEGTGNLHSFDIEVNA